MVIVRNFEKQKFVNLPSQNGEKASAGNKMTRQGQISIAKPYKKRMCSFCHLPLLAILGNKTGKSAGQNTKKMSYFSGCCRNLVIINNLSSMAFFIFFSFTILFQTSMAAEVDDPLLYELSRREEMVQLAGYGEEKLSTVLVTGTVLCEACLHGEPQLRAWPVPGALVTLECDTRRKWSKTSVVQAITDEYGDFTIDLPSHLHAIPNLDKTCSVKVVQIPKGKVCRPSHVKKYRGLKLSSVQNGIRSYTAGEITALHSTSKPLQACTKRGSSHKQIAW